MGWRGGGVIFGPKPIITNLKLNKKERKLAVQTLLYNKRNNISIIGELESLITEFKTMPLKLSTQNLQNVELISASNLNTLSLLRAKQIFLTSSAVNDIKEIYCD